MTSRPPLIVVLVPSDDRPAFHAEPADETAAAEEEAHATGLRGRAEARLRKFKAAWDHAEGRPARLCKRAWACLQARTHPDEPLLARLRAADSVVLHHPADVPPDAAAAHWRDFLAAANRRHWPRFVGNALVSPLTVLLAPLPGPNLVGYWFLYRAVRHALILAGLRKALRGHLPLTLQSPTRLALAS